MNTDKLPKAEEVLKEVYKGDESFVSVFSPYDFEKIHAAMHEYTRQMLDVVAENAQIIEKKEPDFCKAYYYSENNTYLQVDKQSILSFKDKLK